MDLNQTLKSLIAVRLSKGETQETIGRKTGMSQSAVARLENSAGDPTWKQVERYAKALGYTLDANVYEYGTKAPVRVEPSIMKNVQIAVGSDDEAERQMQNAVSMLRAADLPVDIIESGVDLADYAANAAAPCGAVVFDPEDRYTEEDYRYLLCTSRSHEITVVILRGTLLEDAGLFVT